jgi:colicin import membrane protein
MKKKLLHKLSLLCKEVLLCTALLVTVPVASNAQENRTGKEDKMDKLAAKRNVAQARVDKAEADRKSADSLSAEGARLKKEGNLELEQLLDAQKSLEKRIFDVELPAAEKQIKSSDKQEQKLGKEKRNEIRKTYGAEIKLLQAQHAEIQKKIKDAEKNGTRGQEKMKLADKARKEAIAALKAVEKEIASYEDSERAKEREAQQLQKKKESEEIAKQKQKEAAEQKKQKDKEDALAKKEAEKAKTTQIREKIKSKEAEKREKEKAALQRQKEKDAAKREAEKAAAANKQKKGNAADK